MPGTYYEFREGRVQPDSAVDLAAISRALEARLEVPRAVVIYAHGGLVEACDAFKDAVPSNGDRDRAPLVDAIVAAGGYPIFPIYHTGKWESYTGGVYRGQLAGFVEDPRALSVASRIRRTIRELVARHERNRDHVSTQITRTEEHFRYAPLINGGLYTGGRMWSYMKWVVDQSMALDSAEASSSEAQSTPTAAGVALGRVLRDYLQRERVVHGAAPRVMLVGHSTGSIFLTKFVRAWDRSYPEDPTTFELVFLAPAVRYDDFLALNRPAHAPSAVGIRTPMDRVSHLRIFTMLDEYERVASERDVTNILDYAIHAPGRFGRTFGRTFGRAVYDPSLLYAISGILEDHPDTPILGLARFWNERITDYSDGFSHDAKTVSDVRATLGRFEAPFVFTPTDDFAGPGRKSFARSHMEFPGDPLTQQSLMDLIRVGWR